MQGIANSARAFFLILIFFSALLKVEMGSAVEAENTKSNSLCRISVNIRQTPSVFCQALFSGQVENPNLPIEQIRAEISKIKKKYPRVLNRVADYSYCLRQGQLKRRACAKMAGFNSDTQKFWNDYFGATLPISKKLLARERSFFQAALKELDSGIKDWQNSAPIQSGPKESDLPGTGFLPNLDLEQLARSCTVQLVETTQGAGGATLYRVSSGIVARCGAGDDSKCLVTAEHFFANALIGQAQVYYLPSYSSMDDAEPLRYEKVLLPPKDDVRAFPFTWIGQVFQLADYNEQPLPGQDYSFTGYPAVNARQYTMMSCTYLGYSQDSAVYGYAFSCPRFGSQHLGGFSGGPVWDPKTGHVLGVISQQVGNDASGYREQIVTPVMMRNGLFSIGLKERPKSCYDLRKRKPVPCR